MKPITVVVKAEDGLGTFEFRSPDKARAFINDCIEHDCEWMVTPPEVGEGLLRKRNNQLLEETCTQDDMKWEGMCKCPVCSFEVAMVRIDWLEGRRADLLGENAPEEILSPVRKALRHYRQEIIRSLLRITDQDEPLEFKDVGFIAAWPAYQGDR